MNKILILDFGSQVTQLIGRRLRELNVYCEIFPFDKMPALDDSVKGVILSGSPCSVRDTNAPQFALESVKGKLPVLGICYGAQYIAHHCGGKVEGSLARDPTATPFPASRKGALLSPRPLISHTPPTRS